MKQTKQECYCPRDDYNPDDFATALLKAGPPYIAGTSDKNEFAPGDIIILDGQHYMLLRRASYDEYLAMCSRVGLPPNPYSVEFFEIGWD